MTDVKFVRVHPNAVLPSQNDGDVGFDVYAVEDCVIEPRSTSMISIGWKLADEPMVTGACVHGNFRVLMKIEGRSGLASRGLWPVGGILDPSYRGEIIVVMHNSTDKQHYVHAGAKIAQLVLYPVVANWMAYGKVISFKEVENVVQTERNTGGFGSTGV